MTDASAPIANSFLIGAQKSGTTFLASLLNQSPDVCVSDPKEPFYFSQKVLPPREEYARLFSDPDAKIRLDASTTYTFLRPAHALDAGEVPGIAVPVPQRLREHAGNPKLIYILRNPVKRAISALRHHMRDQPQPKGPVSLMAELERDPMVALIGRYADQIERYLEVFDRDEMLFLEFEQLKRDPQAVLDQTCAYLGITSAGIEVDPSTSDKHGAHSLTFAGRRLAGLRQRYPNLMASLKASVPAAIRGPLVNQVLKRPSEVEFADQDEVAALYQPDLERVFQLTGLRI